MEEEDIGSELDDLEDEADSSSLALGDRYASKENACFAVRTNVQQAGLRFKPKYGKNFAKFICATANCPSRFRFKALPSGQWECTVSEPVHNHDTAGRKITHKECLVAPMKDMLFHQPLRSTKSIRQQLQADLGASIGYPLVQKVRRSLISRTREIEARQFSQLPGAVDKLGQADASNGGIFVWNDVRGEDGVRRFQRLFVMPGSSRTLFRFSRPVVGVDGTFTLGIHRQVLLIASIRDTNNTLQASSPRCFDAGHH